MAKVNDNHKHKLLVVDDQVGIVSFLFDFFSIKGFNVFQATSGKKAIAAVQKEKPPVVLLDIRLGWGKDGIQVLKEIKQMAPDTRVIMMTSVAEEDVINEAFTSGADDYIVKPFSLDYLEKVVILKILNLEIEKLGQTTNEE
ncbi:MAG: response regulator [Candidatus Omnitrophota bacterium]